MEAQEIAITVLPESTLNSPVSSTSEPPQEVQDSNSSGSQVDAGSHPAPSTGRLVALDAFRGLTILGMLLVNNAAMDTATPRQLTHASWNQGINFADLVFPWFLLIVGVAIPYAFASHVKRGLSTSAYLLKAASRAITLVALGCFLDSSIAKQPVLGLGVLQLIGLFYFFAVLIYQLPVMLRLAAAAGLLVIHWAAIRFIPVPQLGTGVFLETANLVQYLNQAYLQHLHLKGIISVVPTTALVLIGAALGDLLRDQRRLPIRRAAYLLIGGVALSLAGWLWNLDLPFNKPLWTSPYILCSAGLGTVLLSALYFVTDVKGWKRWAFPLVVFGTNAILAYVLPIVVKVYVLQGWSWPGSHGQTMQQAALAALSSRLGIVCGGWIYTCSYIILWWLVVLEFYRRKVFLRV